MLPARASLALLPTLVGGALLLGALLGSRGLVLSRRGSGRGLVRRGGLAGRVLAGRGRVRGPVDLLACRLVGLAGFVGRLPARARPGRVAVGAAGLAAARRVVPTGRHLPVLGG